MKYIIIFMYKILLRLHSLVLLLAIAGFTYYLIRVTGELPLVLEVEEVAADLLFADPVGWYMDVVGELPDGARLALLSAFAEAGELEVPLHPLTESCHLAQWRGDWKVLSQRREETPLRRTLCQRTAKRQRSAGGRESP
jgi:hypothetical protein